MTMRTGWIGLALGLALGACGDPGGLCVDETCEAAVPVTLVDDGGVGGALRAGAYRIVVDAGYARKEWTCARPDDDCAVDYFTDFTDDDGAGTLAIQARAAAAGLEIQLLETRGKTWRGPAKFTLTVERDGAVVATQTFEPTYKQVTSAEGCVVCLMVDGDAPALHVPI